MTVATVTRHDDDAQLGRYGYRQQFVRSLHNFESFAVAFSFISITTGIFTTFAFVLLAGGPRGIWTWPIVIVGQIILIGPAVFRDAQYYVLGALGVGVLFYLGMWLLSPDAMRAEEGAHGAAALAADEAPAAGGAPGGS